MTNLFLVLHSKPFTSQTLHYQQAFSYFLLVVLYMFSFSFSRFSCIVFPTAFVSSIAMNFYLTKEGSKFSLLCLTCLNA